MSRVWDGWTAGALSYVAGDEGKEGRGRVSIIYINIDYCFSVVSLCLDKERKKEKVGGKEGRLFV